jgi:molybdopterin molybdotransferase
MNALPAARAPLLALDDALAALLSKAQPVLGPEPISTFDADGRVLAQDLVASLDVPAHDNSSMDGYALRTCDWTEGAALPVSQRIPAGAAAAALQPGSAARIFTGAPLPEGADAVSMQEDCEAVFSARAEGAQAPGSADAVRIRVRPAEGQWIRRQGEDVARGHTVLARGQRLGPAELGLAASIGYGQLQVARAPRVALFSTGDELVMPGEVAPADMPPGAIYNSNRFFLRALLRRLGCMVTDFGIVPDRREATVAALHKAGEGHDLILTSGGVSVGEEDHIKPAVEALGELQMWQIAIKPGKPFAYGRLAGGAHFIGLPGNPVSSFVTFVLLVRPFLLALQGATRTADQALQLRADFDGPRADRRREFLRVRRNAAGGLDLFHNQSSGVLTSAVWADGLVDNPAGCVIRAGDMVRYVPLPALLF